MTQPRPLAEAPKDGTIILVHGKGEHPDIISDAHWGFWSSTFDAFILLPHPGEQMSPGTCWQVAEPDHYTFSDNVVHKVAA